MIPSLARSAVIIKSKNSTSIILSNYEMSYALGLLCKVGNFEVPEYRSILELNKKLMPQIKAYQTEDLFEQNLMRMACDYVVTEDFDSQMEELFLMGVNEKSIWNEKEVFAEK